jgi:phage terminase large subunit-like protein
MTPVQTISVPDLPEIQMEMYHRRAGWIYMRAGDQTYKMPEDYFPDLQYQKGGTVQNDPEGETYYFDQEAADSAVRFIETYLHHTSGKWAAKYDKYGNRRDTRIKLEEWQKEEIIRPLFGWKKSSNGCRKYTELYVEIPKKNGKSALIACIECIFLFLDNEPGSELYIACPTGRDKAVSLLLEPARMMVEASPELRALCRILGTEKNTKALITDTAVLKPMTRDIDDAEGVKPQAGFVDEVHAFKKDGVIENLQKSMIIREQPLMVYTTTAGAGQAGVGWEKHKYYKSIKQGLIKNPAALVVMYAADPKDDPFSEATWRKANPMYGITINPEQFQKEVEKARQSSISLNHFKRYHLNIWTGSVEGYVNPDVWAESWWEIDEAELQEMECIAGFDLGARSDLTAVSFQWWTEDKCISKTYYFLPQNQGAESMQDRVHYYQQWVEDGHIILMPGHGRDDDVIVDLILDHIDKYPKLKGLAYDPYQATNIASKLEAAGFMEIYPIRTGARTLAEPTRILKQMVEQKDFNHLQDPVLAWMNGNVLLDTDRNGNITPNRSAKKHKIDGILSNLYAIAHHLNRQAQKRKQKRSMYGNSEK